MKMAAKWRQKRRVVQCVYGQWKEREGTVRHWRRERERRQVGEGGGERVGEKRRVRAGGAPPGLWMGTPPLRPVVSSSRSMCLGRRERQARESVKSREWSVEREGMRNGTPLE